MAELSSSIELENQIKSRYRSIAKNFQESQTSSCCSSEVKEAHTDSSGICCSGTGEVLCCTPSANQVETPSSCCTPSSQLGQEPIQLTNRDNMSLGCDIRLLDIALPVDGEVVVDFGSGPGTDVRKIAKLVGDEGEVIGVDFLKEMVELAQSQSTDYNNVEFIHGDIRNIPINGRLVDLIVSNCVFNLVEDKHQVFSEAFRILRPGGRIVISDMITNAPNAKITAEDYCACIGGAVSIDQYIKIMEKVGFTNISSTKEYESQYQGALQQIPFESVIFSGYKPLS